MPKESTKLIANNKKARFDYFILETFECGIELFGTEVKSMRLGQCSIKESWVEIKGGEVFINGMHINPYEKGNIFNKDPLRVRRLLMHRREIMRLYGQVKQEGYSLIPLALYFKGSRVKLRLGMCKGKRNYDKRADMAEKSARRDIERAIKAQNQ